MNLVFFGSGVFGLPTLLHLARHHCITGVVTQPDRPAGRGGRDTPTPIGAWAAEYLPGTPLLKPERASRPPATGAIRDLAADAWVVIAFGQKLSEDLLADRFAVNLHASLLPRWRGAAPINAAILAGDAITGNSVITLADRMDAGLILGQSRREIGRSQTASDLHDLLAADGPPLVEQVLDSHLAGSLSPAVQDESRVTIASKLSKADGWIDLGDTAEACRRRINALSPWPGVTAMLAGQPLRLLRADAPTDPAPPGPIGALNPSGGFVRCGDGSPLQLIEVQPPGKRAMPWADFARGRQFGDSDLLIGRTPC